MQTKFVKTQKAVLFAAGSLLPDLAALKRKWRVSMQAIGWGKARCLKELGQNNGSFPLVEGIPEVELEEERFHTMNRDFDLQNVDSAIRTR